MHINSNCFHCHPSITYNKNFLTFIELRLFNEKIRFMIKKKKTPIFVTKQENKICIVKLVSILTSHYLSNISTSS